MPEKIVTVEVFQDHCQKQTDDFLTLNHKLDLNSTDNKIVHEEIKAVKRTLDSWNPFILQLQKDISRANAYKIVSEDLKTKGGNWKFWLGLTVLVFSVISGIFYLAEFIKK